MKEFKSSWMNFNASPKNEPAPTIHEPLRLPEGCVEQFEERAAIREYDGGQSRAEAEKSAVKDVFDLLPGQDRGTMTPEEFQAALDVFVMLAKVRDRKNAGAAKTALADESRTR